MSGMSDELSGLNRLLLDPGPQIGPTRAELHAAIDQAGDPNTEGFTGRVLAGLPRDYSAAEIFYALAGLGGVPPGGDGRTIGPGAPGR